MTNTLRRFTTLCCVAISIVGCGMRGTQQGATVLTTDERPDISEDRKEVYITIGTKDHARIKASSLKGLVSNVPDPDSGVGHTQLLTGEYIFDVSQNPRTHLVAIAVRGRHFTETDFSMLFVVNPAFPDKPQLVKFVMPGRKAALDGSTPAFGTVKELYYDESGLLHLVHADASGSKAEVLIGTDLQVRSCKYIRRDEGALCGENH